MTALRTSQLARAAGVARPTLRYYERRGLLPAPERSPGGHRLYPPATLARLHAIRTAQRLGFSLTQISALLPARGPARLSLREQVTARLAAVEAAIAELQSAAAILRSAQHEGCADLSACASTPRCPLASAVRIAPAHSSDGVSAASDAAGRS